jgi:TusA-related sulfurtransferase
MEQILEQLGRADRVLDVRGWACPWCILKAKSELDLLEAGQVLEILVTDPMTLADFPTVFCQSGDQLVQVDEQPKFSRLYLRKGQKKERDEIADAKAGVNAIPNQEEVPMTTTDLESIQAASVVDARGSACPGPLLEAKKGIGKVRVGEVLEILSNDSATKGDIPVWANKVGHEFLGHLEADGYDRIFVVRKK